MKLRTLLCSLLFVGLIVAPIPAYAVDHCGGTGYHQVTTTINIGCRGIGNPISDMLFALIRFLAVGVGLIIVGSLMYAGFAYILARDDPSAVSSAKSRILHTVTALMLYIFAYAILNFLIPGGFFK